MSRILCCIAVPLCLLLPTAMWGAHIRGQVKLEDGQPAPKIVVRIHSDVIAYQDEMQTDPEGKFDFDALPASTYYITIEGQGFRTYNEHVDVSIGPVAYELITLHPDKPKVANVVPPEGPNGTLDARLADVPASALKQYSIAEKLLTQKKDLEGSAKHLRRAITMYANFPEAYAMLGVVYLNQYKLEESQKALQRSIELDPKAAGSYLALGAVFNNKDQYADAEKVLTRGLVLKPDDAAGQCELARTYWLMGKWQEAEPHARKALAFMPEMAAAHVLLGNVALRKHDNASALQEFQEYLKLEPKGPMAGPARAVIAQIEAEPHSSSQKQ